MKNVRKIAESRIVNISKYMAGTPFYCKTLAYTIIVLISTLIDWKALQSLYDAVLNSNIEVSYITALGIVAVLDLYSQWLPGALEYMSKKKRIIIFGIALAAIIVLITALSVAFRISTGDASMSGTTVQLSSSSTTMINVILGVIPVASTLAMLFLSIQKLHWDKLNAVFVNEQVLSELRSKAKELELSDGETINLEKLDNDEFTATVELIKAYAVQAKCDARNKFAVALGDSESAKTLSEPLLPEYVTDSLKPLSISE